jgi:hypothetical protein
MLILPDNFSYFESDEGGELKNSLLKDKVDSAVCYSKLNLIHKMKRG